MFCDGIFYWADARVVVAWCLGNVSILRSTESAAKGQRLASSGLGPLGWETVAPSLAARFVAWGASSSAWKACTIDVGRISNRDAKQSHANE